MKRFHISLTFLIAIVATGMSACASAHWPYADDYIYATVLSCQDTVAARRDIVEQYPPRYANLPTVQKLITDPLTLMTVHVHRHPGLIEWYAGDKVYRFWSPGTIASDVIKLQVTISPEECTNRLLNQTRYFGVSFTTCDLFPPGLTCLLNVPDALEIPARLPELNCRLADALARRPCDASGTDGPPVQGDSWPQQADRFRYRVNVTACQDTTKQRQAWAKDHPRDHWTADFTDTSLATSEIDEADDFIDWHLKGSHFYFSGARHKVHLTDRKFALMDKSPADCRKDLLGRGALCVASDVDCNDPANTMVGCAVNSPLTTCMAEPIPSSPPRFRCDLARVLASGGCRPPAD